MAWVDFRKAYDMVPHSWILETLKLTGIASNVKLRVSMANWKTVLTSNGRTLGEVKIQRGIFQGDSVSPLLFTICLTPLSIVLRICKGKYQLGKNADALNHLLYMDDLKLYGKDEREIDSLVNTVRVISKDIGMEFNLKKCGVLVLKKRKSCEIVKSEGQKMKTIEEDGYKYLGILEYDDVLRERMKDILSHEYFHRVKKVVK